VVEQRRILDQCRRRTEAATDSLGGLATVEGNCVERLVVAGGVRRQELVEQGTDVAPVRRSRFATSERSDPPELLGLVDDVEFGIALDPRRLHLADDHDRDGEGGRQEHEEGDDNTDADARGGQARRAAP